VSDCDVGIVGAGPAGAWAAYCLARRGARVTIFDPSHPREKPCGGGVTRRALQVVADALAGAPIPSSVIRTARFLESGTGQSATVTLDTVDASQIPALVVSSRTAFDAALLDAAVRTGATLIRDRVVDIAVNRDDTTITTARGTTRAGIVLGADGANSLVRRRVARPFDRRQLSLATGWFAHGTTSDEIVIEIARDPPGYVWSFPRPDHLAIGVCAQADAGARAADLRAHVARWIDRTGVGRGAQLEPYSWPIPSLDSRDVAHLTLASAKWALAGDAAGLVDPITREGIYFALLSGEWFADAIAAGRFPSEYVARVRDEIAPELRRAAEFKSGFFRPSFTGMLVRALQRSAPIRSVMADLVSGTQSYATLKWRLIRTFEIGLAWKVLLARG
jgi:geranylgeranyl reductase family protein